MPRAGRQSDAVEIKRFLDDFTGLDVPLKKTQDRMRSPNIATAIEPGVGFCQFKVHEKEQNVKGEAVFPRGLPIPQLMPIVHKTLEIILRRYPTSGPWPLWASVDKGVDERGKKDGGKRELEEWSTYLPGSEVVMSEAGRWIVLTTIDICFEASK